MIGTTISGITTVVCGNYKAIILSHCPLNIRNPAIKIFQPPRIPFRISAVTPEHVEIDEVGENKSLCRPPKCLIRLVDSFAVLVRLEMLTNSGEIKNRGDLSDSNRGETRIAEVVQQRPVRRRDSAST